jgi:hypothetical protein
VLPTHGEIHGSAGSSDFDGHSYLPGYLSWRDEEPFVRRVGARVLPGTARGLKGYILRAATCHFVQGYEPTPCSPACVLEDGRLDVI